MVLKVFLEVLDTILMNVFKIKKKLLWK